MKLFGIWLNRPGRSPKEEFLHPLSERLRATQEEIIQSPHSRLRVVAGPGTGKTLVLTRRIAHLVRSGTDPRRICALTFSRRAALEMKARVFQLLPLTASRVHVSTFHSLCFWILARHGLLPDRRLATGMLKRELLQQLATRHQCDMPPRRIALEISRAKNRGIDPERYLQLAGDRTAEKVGLVYRDYEQLKKLPDYDDLILRACQLLMHDGHRVKERFSHILVDEFQDVSDAQYQLLKLLVASPGTSLFAVGDPAQCIYQWRLANPRKMEQLEDDFSTHTFHLVENFRSARRIVECSNLVLKRIAPNRPRLRNAQQSEGRVLVAEIPTELHEAEWVATKIEETHQPGDCAVLVRSNAQMEEIERALARRKIPFSEFHNFYHRREVRTVLDILRAIDDPEHHVRQLVRYSRLLDPYLGREFEDELNRHLQRQLGLFDALGADFSRRYMAIGAEKLRQFLQNLRKVQRKRGVAGVISELRRTLNLDENLLWDHEPQEPEEETIVARNLNRLTAMAEDFRTIREFLEHVRAQMASSGRRGAVNILTAHRAKGLEFKHVWVLGVARGLFPLERENEDEEWRLFYVAITRAKHTLTICALKSHRGEPLSPAPFLDPILRPEGGKHRSGPLWRLLKAIIGR